MRAARKLLEAIYSYCGYDRVELIEGPKRKHYSAAETANRCLQLLCKTFERGEISPIVDYTVRSFRDNARVRLLPVRKKTKGGWKTFAFVSCRTLPISMAYRDEQPQIKKFRARYWHNMELRRIYYALTALPYNL